MFCSYAITNIDPGLNQLSKGIVSRDLWITLISRTKFTAQRGVRLRIASEFHVNNSAKPKSYAKIFYTGFRGLGGLDSHKQFKPKVSSHGPFKVKIKIKNQKNKTIIVITISWDEIFEISKICQARIIGEICTTVYEENKILNTVTKKIQNLYIVENL